MDRVIDVALARVAKSGPPQYLLADVGSAQSHSKPHMVPFIDGLGSAAYATHGLSLRSEAKVPVGSQPVPVRGTNNAPMQRRFNVTGSSTVQTHLCDFSHLRHVRVSEAQQTHPPLPLQRAAFKTRLQFASGRRVLRRKG